MPRRRPLRLFVCGPTVYDYSHIGHARTYLAFDIIVRYLRSQTIPVFYLQNITDVDDKIIERAKIQNISPQKIAQIFQKEYRQDIKTLGITSVNQYAPASKFIKEIQKQISRLIKKGYAYQTKSGIYFEVKKFSGYGKLSKQNLDALRPGYRIEPDPEKKDPMDFALWKIHKYSEPLWPSPWGTGRPGWHIEDTAISEKFFGPRYDLHGGSMDLKFPHHESEIAQQEAASGKKPFVKIWMHTGFLLVNNEKMSKSLGNFITIKDFLKNYSPEVLRLIIVSHHYRSPINYNESLAEQARASLKNLRHFISKLNLIKTKRAGLEPAEKITAENIKTLIKKTDKAFHNAMEDDFNTQDALAELFKLINIIEPKIWSLRRSEARLIKDIIVKNLAVFGISLKKTEKISPAARKIVKERELCRAHKQFIQADALRKKAEGLGYIIEDTPAGPLISSSDD